MSIIPTMTFYHTNNDLSPTSMTRNSTTETDSESASLDKGGGGIKERMEAAQMLFDAGECVCVCVTEMRLGVTEM